MTRLLESKIAVAMRPCRIGDIAAAVLVSEGAISTNYGRLTSPA